jgi:ribosomal protein S18 acetylase RimI-like enzyme
MIKPYSNKFKEDLLNLIKEIGKSFVPKITERITNEGYLEYVLGGNEEYIKKKYGSNSHLPKDVNVLVYLDENENLLGFLSYFGYFQPYDSGYLCCIMVNERHQGKGIGTSLLKNLLDKTEQTDMSVTTWSTNNKSRSLFNKFNFDLVERVKDERKNGIDGLYYKKRVSNGK